MHWYEAQQLEYERERLPKHDKEGERKRVPFENYYEPQECPGSSRSATSSAILGSVNTAAKEDDTAIPEAATEHSQIRRLLTLANAQEAKRPRKSGKGTDFACQEAKRPRKSGKGTGFHTRTASPDPKDVAG